LNVKGISVSLYSIAQRTFLHSSPWV